MWPRADRVHEGEAERVGEQHRCIPCISITRGPLAWPRPPAPASACNQAQTRTWPRIQRFLHQHEMSIPTAEQIAPFKNVMVEVFFKTISALHNEPTTSQQIKQSLLAVKRKLQVRMIKAPSLSGPADRLPAPCTSSHPGRGPHGRRSGEVVGDTGPLQAVFGQPRHERAGALRSGARHGAAVSLPRRPCMLPM